VIVICCYLLLFFFFVCFECWQGWKSEMVSLITWLKMLEVNGGLEMMMNMKVVLCFGFSTSLHLSYISL